MLLFSDTNTADDINENGIFVGFLQNPAWGLSIAHRGIDDFNFVTGAGAGVRQAWDGAVMGTDTFTLEAKLIFTDTDVEVSFTVTDSASFSDTISTSIPLEDITLGDYFGVGSRTRQRDGDNEFEMDVQSFKVVPPPPSGTVITIR